MVPRGIWGGGEGVVVGAQVTVFSNSAQNSVSYLHTVHLSHFFATEALYCMCRRALSLASHS